MRPRRDATRHPAQPGGQLRQARRAREQAPAGREQGADPAQQASGSSTRCSRLSASTASKLPGAASSVSADATSKRTLSTPAAAAFSRAMAIIASDRSVASTSRTRGAWISAVPPVPQPSSSRAWSSRRCCRVISSLRA